MNPQEGTIAVRLKDREGRETEKTFQLTGKVLDPSAELKCLHPGPVAQQYLVVWSGEVAGGMIYVRGGAVYFKEYTGREVSYRERFRRWWFWNVGISLPF